MFSKLPDLFNKNFVIGFFLPFALFLAANYFLLSQYGLLDDLIQLSTSSQFEVLVGTTIIGLVSWFGGVCLLVVNKDIFRIMEGYGIINPLRLVRHIERRRYRKLKAAIQSLDRQYSDCLAAKKAFPQDLRVRRNQLMRELVTRFPDQEQWLLPTAIGNIVRAFEIYPRVMYGVDAIPSWNRLMAVIPLEFLQYIDDAKSQVDFWVNIGFISLLTTVEYFVLALSFSQFRVVWFPVLALLVAVAAYVLSGNTAKRWGDLVKAAYDIYLPDLQEKLGFQELNSAEEERLQWRSFSQALIYRLPEQMPERFRETEQQQEQEGLE